MFSKSVTSVLLTVAAFSAIANAQLKVLSPGGPDLWWVAKSSNTLLWNCQQSQVQNFTIVLTNTNPTILNGALPIVAIEQNFDCSKTITQQQADLPVSTGYKVLLANPLNSTDVYASSDEFEIKALGATYPASSATPQATTSTSSGASGTSTAGASGSTSNSNGAQVIAASRYGAAAVGVVAAGLGAMLF